MSTSIDETVESTKTSGPLIRVWSDYMCPFCYVGVERAAWLQERFGATIEWHPFDLHPEYPPQGIARKELDAKYGAGMRAQVAEMFAAAGLPHTTDLEIVPNTRKARQVAELARERGVLDAVHHRLMDAYWARGRDIGGDDVLVEEAVAAGLDEADVRDVLGSDAYADVLARETQAVMEMGGTGVPAWVVDDRVLIPGAQPHDVFERVLTELGYEPRTAQPAQPHPGQPNSAE
jgi:predicted DsbA family dithiol-disulfide isomerase